MRGLSGGVRLRGAALLLALACLGPVGAEAAGVKFFRMQTREAYLAGTLDGISVDPLGTLALADRAARVADLEEPFLFAAAEHPDGWVVGTGNSGKVLLIDREGESRTLFEAPEPEVFAVWADPGGTTYAGTSPNGKVYRLTADGSEVFFDPQQTYIWALAPAADGSLLVATGTEGKLFAVDSAGSGRVLYDSEDTHLRALEPAANGDLLVGTAGRGLILRVRPDGSARMVHDAAEPEVVAFARVASGGAYAALLASEASHVDLKRSQEASERRNGDDEEENGEEGGSVRVTVAPATGGDSELVGSRPPGFTGPRAQILHLSEDGRVETVWRFDKETVYDLRWSRGRLWVATGQEGKIYSLRDRKMVLEQDVGERQAVALMADSPGPAFATTNAAAIYRISGESQRGGTFTSPALDAGQVSRFGALRWRGELPRGTTLAFSLRSGLSAEPDPTWSSWGEPRRGREVRLAEVPAGRYLQWRAEFTAADGRSPSLSQVEISYRQINLPPRVEELKVLGPGQILVPASFNPSNQVFEPAHPNKDGIFTTLEPARPKDSRRKMLWKKGFRTLQWKADDPNGDELAYSLSFRPLAGDSWLPMAQDLDETTYSFDATALPDGTYRFRLEVADRNERDLDEALVAREISEPVVIDHHPPRLGPVRSEDGSVTVTVTDALNPLRTAEVSVDAGDWREVSPGDGILDGLAETFTLEASADAALVLLRVSDAAFNTVTFDLSREQP